MKGTKSPAKGTKSTAKDPVCGMQVEKDTALQAERDGKTYYFCSEECQQKFERGEE